MTTDNDVRVYFPASGVMIPLRENAAMINGGYVANVDYQALAAKVDSLTAEVGRLREREAELEEQVCTVTGWCQAANTRAEAAEANARRYLALRNEEVIPLGAYTSRDGETYQPLWGDSLDRAIDIRITAREKANG